MVCCCIGYIAFGCAVSFGDGSSWNRTSPIRLSVRFCTPRLWVQTRCWKASVKWHSFCSRGTDARWRISERVLLGRLEGSGEILDTNITALSRFDSQFVFYPRESKQPSRKMPKLSRTKHVLFCYQHSNL